MPMCGWAIISTRTAHGSNWNGCIWVPYKTSEDNLNSYDGHDLLNLRAEYELTENLSVFGRLANILDTRYADRADFSFGSDRYFPGEDRALYAGATVRF